MLVNPFRTSLTWPEVWAVYLWVYTCACMGIGKHLLGLYMHVASYLTSWLDQHNIENSPTSMHACHFKSKIVILAKHLVTTVEWLSLLGKFYECIAGNWELMQWQLILANILLWIYSTGKIVTQWPICTIGSRDYCHALLHNYKHIHNQSQAACATEERLEQV